MRRVVWFWVAGAAAAALPAGCTPDVGPAGKRLLLDAYAACEQGDDAATLRRTDEFLQRYGRSLRAGEAYYLRGLAKDRAGDARGAEADFSAAVRRAGDDRTRAYAHLALGDLAYRAGDLPAAKRHYRDCLAAAVQPASARARRGPVPRAPAENAYFRLGCLLQDQGRWQEADVAFSRLIHAFDQTPPARLAVPRLHATAWTVQTGAFAEKHNADARVRRLANVGFRPIAWPVLRGGRVVHLVRIGRYPTRGQAEATCRTILRHQGDAFVTVTR